MLFRNAMLFSFSFPQPEEVPMPHLETIMLKDIRCIRHWKDTPPGALLQLRFAATDEVFIGMRASLEIGIADFVLVLEGSNAGLLLSETEVHAPVLDVSGLLALGVADAGPFVARVGSGHNLGQLYRYIEADAEIYMWSSTSNHVMGWTCVFDAASTKVGRVAKGLRLEHIIGLGVAIALPLTEQ
jgi:hypothetical protein